MPEEETETQEAANLAEVVAVAESGPEPARESPRDPSGRFVADHDPRPDADAWEGDFESLQEAQSRWAARQELSGKDRDRVLSDRVARESYQTALLREQAMKAGLVPPSDSMDVKTWARAFEGKQARGARGEDSPALPTEPEVRGEAYQAAPDADAQRAEDQKILDDYQQRLAAFKVGHDDFDSLVGGLELSPSAQVAVLEEENGPAVAYHIASHPELAQRLNQMGASRAVAEVGKIAAQLAARTQEYDAAAGELLGIDISPGEIASFQNRARELQKTDPLSDEELATSAAVAVAPHIVRAVLALDAPELVVHFARNPHMVGRLNQTHPIAAMGELHALKAELQRERDARAGHRERLPKPIEPTRRTGTTDRALSDSLSTEEWATRFRRKMGYEGR